MTAHDAEYDRYFGILRHPARPGTARLRAGVLRDLPHTRLGEDQRAVLVSGLWLASRAVEARADAGFGTAPVDGLPDALCRWKLGHQLFHLLLTAMNTALDDALAATRGAAWPELVAAMGELRLLYDAATAAMDYAADFPAATYRDEIRPTMEPPYMPPGFSGVFNRDHRAMVRRMRGLERSVRILPQDIPDPGTVRTIHRGAAALRAAQRRNRRHHGRICERCVPGGASLLRTYLDRRRAQEDSPCDRD
ncbi:hypothetical protein [Streptomyces sp. NPDC002537]